jgi:hypothetical protein
MPLQCCMLAFECILVMLKSRHLHHDAIVVPHMSSCCQPGKLLDCPTPGTMSAAHELASISTQQTSCIPSIVNTSNFCVLLCAGEQARQGIIAARAWQQVIRRGTAAARAAAARHVTSRGDRAAGAAAAAAAAAAASSSSSNRSAGGQADNYGDATGVLQPRLMRR